MHPTRLFATLLIASTLLALAPLGHAATDTNQPPLTQATTTPPVCSPLGNCATATVTGTLIPYDETHPCRSDPDGTYTCEIHWVLTVESYGLPGCGWAYTVPTGQALQCAALGLAVSAPSEGYANYTVPAGARYVSETISVCAAFGERTQQTCEDYPASYELPALGSTQRLDLVPIVESVVETTAGFANAVLAYVHGVTGV